MGKEKATPSPFFQPNESIGAFKLMLLQHLDLLRMPSVHGSLHSSQPCDRDCHIVERNHTLETIRHFINSPHV